MTSNNTLKESKEGLKENQLNHLKTLYTYKNLHDDVDVDDYLSQTEIELKLIGHSLSQRMFSEAVITVLDKLMDGNVGNKFNRLIFLYILDTAHLNKDSHIQL